MWCTVRAAGSWGTQGRVNAHAAPVEAALPFHFCWIRNGLDHTLHHDKICVWRREGV